MSTKVAWKYVSNGGKFVYPMSIGWISTVLILLLSCLHLAPEVLLSYLPSVYSICMSIVFQSPTIVEYIYYSAWLIHTAEAMYAMWILVRNGWFGLNSVPWLIVTFVVGYPSLIHLVNADAHLQRKQKVNK